MSRIYLSSPHMGGTELDYVHEAFNTNWIAPLGANVNGFEKDLAAYTGRKEAAAVTSGTAALHLALILCGVEQGDEVFCQSFTFTASANPIRYQGAKPVFIDSEPETWNMDPDLMEKALRERVSGRGREWGSGGDGEWASTDDSPEPSPGSSVELPGENEQPSSVRREENLEALRSDKKSSSNIRQSTESRQSKSGLPKAIIVVHLYGMPAKMDRILEIAWRYGVPVIEDAAEALGSTLNGKNCGNFGKFSVLSFNGNKIITTSGGGALLSDDAAKIQKARFLATQARDDAPHYQHSELGYNYRLSNISAGIGRGQMEVLDDRVAARRANHEFYFENLGQTWWQPETHWIKGSKSTEGNKFPPFQGGTQGGGQPSTFNKQPATRNPQPATRNPQPSTFNLQPSTKPSPTGIYFLPEPPGYFSNRWLTTILVNPEETGGVTREDIRLALEEKSIECRPLWKPMHQQPLYEGCEYYGHGVSDFLFEYGLCLPSGSNLTDDEREMVLGEIKAVLGE